MVVGHLAQTRGAFDVFFPGLVDPARPDDPSLRMPEFMAFREALLARIQAEPEVLARMASQHAVDETGASDLYSSWVIDRYGRGLITPPEIATAFRGLVDWVETGVRPTWLPARCSWLSTTSWRASSCTTVR